MSTKHVELYQYRDVSEGEGNMWHKERTTVIEITILSGVSIILYIDVVVSSALLLRPLILRIVITLQGEPVLRKGSLLIPKYIRCFIWDINQN